MIRRSLTSLAAVCALTLLAGTSPAFANIGQCYDAFGRPFGPPHNTDNPPYDLICRAYRIGGSCTHVQPGWAESQCGIGPRYPAYRWSPYYDPRFPDSYRYYNRGLTPQERLRQRQLRRDLNLKFEPAHPDPAHPPIPDRGPPNQAR